MWVSEVVLNANKVNCKIFMNWTIKLNNFRFLIFIAIVEKKKELRDVSKTELNQRHLTLIMRIFLQIELKNVGKISLNCFLISFFKIRWTLSAYWLFIIKYTSHNECRVEKQKELYSDNIFLAIHLHRNVARKIKKIIPLLIVCVLRI